MRIALAQLNPTIGDFDGTFRLVEQAFAQAKDQRVRLLIFSELVTTGYPPRDLLTKTAFVAANNQLVERIAELTKAGVAAIIGCVSENAGAGNPLFNSAALLDRGAVQTTRHKTLLPTYDVFDEDRYFCPASSREPIVWEGWRIGVTICEDIWFGSDDLGGLYQKDPLAELAKAGVDFFVNISASPFTLGKSETRRQLIAAQSKKHGTPILMVNQVGAHDDLVFDGHSMAIDSDGATVARARDFEPDFLTLEIEKGGSRVDVRGRLRPCASSGAEEVHNALVLGIRDYTRRCGFEKVVLGLSGGIDSALTAVLAQRALGSENVLGVAMPSRYSSDGSVTDARSLAENLGIDFEIIPIEPVFKALNEIASGVFEGLPSDVTEENFQARARGTLLMGLSNKFGSLLLTTGNKSELAVGYCTLYGDMCGGLAVISDVPKTLVYEISRWINRDAEVIPWDTITKPPSAELREDQKDQDSLPPYDELDALIEAYVENNRSIEQIVATGLDEEMVRRWVKVINRNEYKRRQAAPGLRVTSKAFGTGRRMPIAANYGSAG